MKKRFILILVVLSSILLFNACNKDEGVNTNDDDSEENSENLNNEITATETCSYSDFDIQENTTITINCLLDLEGQTITIPAGVTFEFDGGDVFNGTLNFSSNGKIDGELLNSKVEIQGDVQLTNEIFNFFASRWTDDITEGTTDSDTALKNNTELENLLFFVKELGGTTFKIDDFDAYFEVTRVTSTTSNQNFYPSLEALNIPSDFNLIMTDKTNLRIFPGDVLNKNGGGILAVRDGENITITGGNLYGDRDERIYSPDEGGEEGAHLLRIHSGRNITVDGIHFENGSAGAIAIASFGFTFNDDYNPTDGVIIKNCEFLNIRRMSIALTDGKNVTIQNNNFTNIGQASANSTGGEVGYAINIEPYRIRDDNGNLVEYQKVTDALIKGNTETNSRGGFLTLTIGQDLTVEDNTIDTRIVWSFVSGTKVRNNTFNASGSWAAESWAFFAAGTGETVFDNEFTGNTITGYASGAIIGSVDAEVHDNNISNVSTGIQLSQAFNAKVYNNTITAENQGIYVGNTYTNGSEITNNTITTSGFLMKISNINNNEGEENYTIVVDENDFKSNGTASIYLSNGATFSNNTVQGGVQIGDASNITIANNTITPNESDGIRIYNENENISILNNIIYEPTGADRYECLNNESTTPNEIVLSGNSCN